MKDHVWSSFILCLKYKGYFWNFTRDIGPPNDLFNAVYGEEYYREVVSIFNVTFFPCLVGGKTWARIYQASVWGRINQTTRLNESFYSLSLSPLHFNQGGGWVMLQDISRKLIRVLRNKNNLRNELYSQFLFKGVLDKKEYMRIKIENGEKFYKKKI